MTLKRWEPLREIDDMLDRYARAFGWPSGRDKSLSTTGDWSPNVDISETDDEFVVDAELPDVNKDGVKISLDNGILSIQGERKQEKEEKGRTFHRIERYYGNFSRSFTLPDNVDESKVKARFKDGVLNIQIPKTSEKKNNAIEVKVE